jgi:hypothetical protein
MGKQDGFDNSTTKKLHDVGVAVMRKTRLSIHENVMEFDEDSLHHLHCLIPFTTY